MSAVAQRPTLLARVRSFFTGASRRSTFFSDRELRYLDGATDHHELEARERELMQRKVGQLRVRFPI